MQGFDCMNPHKCCTIPNMHRYPKKEIYPIRRDRSEGKGNGQGTAALCLAACLALAGIPGSALGSGDAVDRNLADAMVGLEGRRESPAGGI